MIWHLRAPVFALKVGSNKVNISDGLIGDSEIIHVERRGDVKFNKTGIISDVTIGKEEFFYGANYVAMYVEHADGTDEFKLHEITHKNELHMGLILPQYFVMTCGEVMFSITGLEFAFSQVSNIS